MLFFITAHYRLDIQEGYRKSLYILKFRRRATKESVSCCTGAFMAMWVECVTYHTHSLTEVHHSVTRWETWNVCLSKAEITSHHGPSQLLLKSGSQECQELGLPILYVLCFIDSNMHILTSLKSKCTIWPVMS